MRWYRLAIQAEGLEEQFSYFWFALEIAAESLKGKEKVPSKCPRCQGNLFCETCKEYPMHRRYAGEAIQQVIQSVHPENPEEVFKTLQLIRHTLMHGGRLSSVLDQLPCDEQQAVNKLASVTWQAIGRMFSNPDPRPEEPLNFGYCDNLIRRTLVVGVHIKTRLIRGDPNNPQLADFPHVQIDALPAPWPTEGKKNE
ncbi:MAG: methylamine utilization protein MauJ [Nitrospiria bacterium]